MNLKNQIEDLRNAGKDDAPLMLLGILAELATRLEALENRPTAQPTAQAPPPAGDGARIPFGKKHKGELVSEVWRSDPEYLEYLLTWEGLREPLRKSILAVMGRSE